MNKYWLALMLAVIVLIGTGCLDQNEHHDDQLNTELPIVIEDDTPPDLSYSEIEDLGERELQLAVNQTDQGFDINLLGERPSVMQSLSSPRGEVVHLVRRIESTDSAEWYRMDVIIVNPQLGEVRVETITNAEVNDSYTVDSIVRAYGFLDDHQMFYVTVDHPKEGTMAYHLETMNILTGEKTRLFENEPKDISPDYYHAWLTSDRSTFVIIGVEHGEMRIYDLNMNQITILENKFPSSWPTFSLHVSPDGEMFWNDFKLFDLSGSEIATIPVVEGFWHYPMFQWSPEGKYASLHYTYDDSFDHVLNSDAPTYEIAPQSVNIFNRSGQLVREIKMEQGDQDYVEIVGWLKEDESVLVHRYDIQRNPNSSTQEKVNSTIEIINVSNGETQKLQEMNLESSSESDAFWPAIIATRSGWKWSRYFVDEEQGTFRMNDQSKVLIDISDDDLLYILMQDKQSTTIYRFDPAATSSSLKNIKLDRWYQFEWIFYEWYIGYVDQVIEYIHIDP